MKSTLYLQVSSGLAEPQCITSLNSASLYSFITAHTGSKSTALGAFQIPIKSIHRESLCKNPHLTHRFQTEKPLGNFLDSALRTRHSSPFNNNPSTTTVVHFPSLPFEIRKPSWPWTNQVFVVMGAWAGSFGIVMKPQSREAIRSSRS